MTPTWRLVKWLGPWASSERLPVAVEVKNTDIEGPSSPISVKHYRPAKTRVRGLYLVAQGLHYRGPDDLRMDRFCRILANAGFEVVAPRLPSYMGMRLEATVITEFQAVFDALDELTTVRAKPAVFSISFGSLPVLRLASNPAYSDRISAVITFGGYMDWIAALHFTLSGRVEYNDGFFEKEPDPLNQPAIFMNFVGGMELDSQGTERLHRTWFDYIRATWGREECRQRAVHEAVAEEFAQTLPEALQHLFMLGCGLRDQDEALGMCLAANERDPRLGEALNVSAYLSGIKAPVHLFHGLDDDVFPFTQMEMLKDGMPPDHEVRTYLTGMYGHTGSQFGPTSGVFGEVRTMLKMLKTLANAPGKITS